MATNRKATKELVAPHQNGKIIQNADGTWDIRGMVLDPDGVVYTESQSAKHLQMLVNINLYGIAGVGRGGSRILITC